MSGSLAFTSSTLTIASGSVTATRSHHVIAAQTGTADDLANIATGSVSDFCILILRPDSGDTITVKHAATGAGEIHLSDDADFAMSNDMGLLLQRRGSDWYELSRSEIFAATQTLMEAAASNIVTATPGNMNWHPGMAKAWAVIDQVGTIAVLASHNLDGGTPVVDNAVGEFTLNWGIDFSSASYSIAGIADNNDGTEQVTVSLDADTAPTAGAAKFNMVGHTGTFRDVDPVCVVAFGDQ